MREWKKAKVVAEHCLFDKAPAKTKIIKKMVIENIFVPADDLFVEPACLTKHDHRIEGKEGGRDRMFFDASDQLMGPGKRRWIVGDVLLTRVQGLPQQQSTAHSQEGQKRNMGYFIVFF